MSKRTRARELVLKCLYAFETLGGDAAAVFDQNVVRSPQDEELIDFASQLYHKIIDKETRIDREIRKYAENWDFERFAVVDKNILRMAVCEFFFFPDIPARVTINEAIELAKKYSTMDSSSFVNGILDAIFRANSQHFQDTGKLMPASHIKPEE